MRRFRSLLIDDAAIRMPGLAVIQLALHRHLGEHAMVEPHRHRWCQALLYLKGAGEQTVGAERIAVGPGSLVVMPAGAPHAFVRAARRTPLCLMINFRLSGGAQRERAVCLLSKGEIARVREILVQLIRLDDASPDDLRWQGAVLVLELLTSFLHAAGWFAAPKAKMQAKPKQALGRLLATVDPAESLAAIVRRSGYQRDHFNRLVRAETGLSLGQFRARLRIRRAETLLRDGWRVAEVAAQIGLPDQGYFARWFRRHNGATPTEWAARHPARTAAGSGRGKVLARLR